MEHFKWTTSIGNQSARLSWLFALSSRGSTSAESTFNEMLGINGLSISKVSYEVYANFGNIIARLLSIGGCSDAVALLNLNACVLYATELSTLNCYLSVNTPLGCLANLKNVHVLVQEVTKYSTIFDGTVNGPIALRLWTQYTRARLNRTM